MSATSNDKRAPVTAQGYRILKILSLFVKRAMAVMYMEIAHNPRGRRLNINPLLEMTQA